MALAKALCASAISLSEQYYASLNASHLPRVMISAMIAFPIVITDHHKLFLLQSSSTVLQSEEAMDRIYNFTKGKTNK